MKLNEILLSIVSHPDLQAYFNEGLTVFTEREFLTDDQKILKPDRLILEDGRVTIIDYKTGKPEAKHKQQIQNYALALQQLNFEINKKLLVYIENDLGLVNVLSV